MWRIESLSPYLLLVMCPWFAVRFSGGTPDLPYYAVEWHGIRVYWGHAKGWIYREGESIFSREDRALSFQIGMYQRELRRGVR